MAQELIPTSIQEEISIDYFDLFFTKGWDVSDGDYIKLVEDSFGPNGKFPFVNNFPNTEKGRNDQEIWLASFDKQGDAGSNLYFLVVFLLRDGNGQEVVV